MEQMLAQAEEDKKSTEGFGNIFPQLNLTPRCMMLIILMLVLFLFKDSIMGSDLGKSIKKSLSSIK
jgi:hypothetical protein